MSITYYQLKADEVSQPVVSNVKHEYAVLHDCQILFGKAVNFWKLKLGDCNNIERKRTKKKIVKTLITLIM